MFKLFLLTSILISVASPRHHGLEESYIAKGGKATIETFPYLAVLEMKSKHHCGAAIINNTTLITAAHCLSGRDDPDREKPGLFQIRVGSDVRDTKGKVFRVLDFVRHDEFNVACSMYRFDIAIVWIKGEMSFDADIRPVDLPSHGSCKSGSQAVVSGWGQTWPKGVKTKSLQQAQILIWNEDKCEDVYKCGNFGPETICANDEKNGAGPCKGDSGGPLVSDGKLCGIVSGGRVCDEPKKPAVFTRVSYFLEWIQKVLDKGPR